MRRTTVLGAAAALAAVGLAGVGTAPAAAAGAADDVLLPHPGPDGLVWVPEQTGDGGVVSGGANEGLPTVLTVACEGGGSLHAVLRSQETEVAALSVDCIQLHRRAVQRHSPRLRRKNGCAQGRRNTAPRRCCGTGAEPRASSSHTEPGVIGPRSRP